MKRPIGVWCYDKNTNELIKPEDWTTNNVSGGVVVVTEEHAFRVLSHNNISLQWGDPNKDTALCRDRAVLSGEGLTNDIIETYKGIEYKDYSNNEYNFVGSPAAEFCKSLGGYLPSVVELKTMAKYIDDINRCMAAMGLPVLSIGWYWSSVEYCSSYACSVSLPVGSIYFNLKDCSHDVCTVSAFQV